MGTWEAKTWCALLCRIDLEPQEVFARTDPIYEIRIVLWAYKQYGIVLVRVQVFGECTVRGGTQKTRQAYVAPAAPTSGKQLRILGDLGLMVPGPGRLPTLAGAMTEEALSRGCRPRLCLQRRDRPPPWDHRPSGLVHGPGPRHHSESSPSDRMAEACAHES